LLQSCQLAKYFSLIRLTRDALLFPNGDFAFINRDEGKPFELLRLDLEQTPVSVAAPMASRRTPKWSPTTSALPPSSWQSSGHEFIRANEVSSRWQLAGRRDREGFTLARVRSE
jgi:hypothetical protein